MKRFLPLLSLLALLAPTARAATGLSSTLMTNHNGKSFIVDLSLAPTNMVKVNLRPPGQPDGPGDIWTFVNNFVGTNQFWQIGATGGLTNLQPANVDYYPSSVLGWYAGTNTASRASLTFSSPFGVVSGPNGIKLHDDRGTFLEFSDKVFSPLQTNTDLGWDGGQGPEFLFRNMNLSGSAFTYGYFSDASNFSLGRAFHSGTNGYYTFSSESVGDAGVPRHFMFTNDTALTTVFIENNTGQIASIGVDNDRAVIKGGVAVDLYEGLGFGTLRWTGNQLWPQLPNAVLGGKADGSQSPNTPWGEVHISDAGTLYFGTNTMTQVAHVPLWNGAAWPGGDDHLVLATLTDATPGVLQSKIVGGDGITIFGTGTTDQFLTVALNPITQLWYSYTTPDAEGGTIYSTASTNTIGAGAFNFAFSYLTNFNPVIDLSLSIGYPVIDIAARVAKSNVALFYYGVNSENGEQMTNSYYLFNYGVLAGAGPSMLVSNSHGIFNYGVDVGSESVYQNSLNLFNYGKGSGNQCNLIDSSYIFNYGEHAGDTMSLTGGGTDIYSFGKNANASLVKTTNVSHIFVLGSGVTATNSNDWIAGDNQYNYKFPGASFEVAAKITGDSGFSSLDATAAVAVSATGWTNTFGKNARVWIDGTDVTYTIYDAAVSPYYTNAVSVGHSFFVLNTGEKFIVTAGTGVTGVAKP